jgi:hypothetical protein
MWDKEARERFSRNDNAYYEAMEMRAEEININEFDRRLIRRLMERVEPEVFAEAAKEARGI